MLVPDPQGTYNVSIFVFGEPILASPYQLNVTSLGAAPAPTGSFDELDSILAEYGLG